MRIRLIIPAIATILLCLILASRVGAQQHPKGLIDVAMVEAPHFVVKDIDGNKYSYGKPRGRWMFIHFWASWCGPCRREIPELEKLSQSELAKKMEMVVINTGESEDTIFEFLAQYAPNLHTYMDSDGLVTESYSPRGLPATYLVNPQGKIVYQALGGLHWTQPNYYRFLESLTASANN